MGGQIGSGGAVYGPYGNPSGPIGSGGLLGGGGLMGGSGPMGHNHFSGLLPPDLEQKTSVLLPLAGAALLGKLQALIVIT